MMDTRILNWNMLRNNHNGRPTSLPFEFNRKSFKYFCSKSILILDNGIEKEIKIGDLVNLKKHLKIKARLLELKAKLQKNEPLSYPEKFFLKENLVLKFLEARTNKFGYKYYSMNKIRNNREYLNELIDLFPLLARRYYLKKKGDLQKSVFQFLNDVKDYDRWLSYHNDKLLFMYLEVMENIDNTINDINLPYTIGQIDFIIQNLKEVDGEVISPKRVYGTIDDYRFKNTGSTEPITSGEVNYIRNNLNTMRVIIYFLHREEFTVEELSTVADELITTDDNLGYYINKGINHFKQMSKEELNSVKYLEFVEKQSIKSLRKRIKRSL